MINIVISHVEMIVESVFYDRILIAKFPESLVLMFFC